MLIKLLSADDKAHFLMLAELLSIADKPLLWDGKMKDEVTSRTDMKKMSFAKGEAESKLLSDWHQEINIGAMQIFGGDALEKKLFGEKITEVERLLLDKLGDIPFHKNTEDSIDRLNAVSAALHYLLAHPPESVSFFDLKKSLDSKNNCPETALYSVRVMLYELMLMALAGGGISSIEFRVLEIFKQHHQVDDCDFNELLERAETMYREVQKTIALVLE